MKIIMLCSLFLAQAVLANEAQFSDVVDFIEQEMVGQEFKSPLHTFTIEEGKLESDSETIVTISNFEQKNKLNVSFQMKMMQKQINYNLDENGERILPGADVTRENLVQFSFTQRRSSGKVYGISYSLGADTGYENFGELLFLNGELTLIMRSPEHVDAYSSQSSNGKPALLGSIRTFGVDAQGVYFKSKEIGYDVDLKTGAISKYAEVERLFRTIK